MVWVSIYYSIYLQRKATYREETGGVTLCLIIAEVLITPASEFRLLPALFTLNPVLRFKKGRIRSF